MYINIARMLVLIVLRMRMMLSIAVINIIINMGIKSMKQWTERSQRQKYYSAGDDASYQKFENRLLLLCIYVSWL